MYLIYVLIIIFLLIISLYFYLRYKKNKETTINSIQNLKEINKDLKKQDIILKNPIMKRNNSFIIKQKPNQLQKINSHLDNNKKEIKKYEENLFNKKDSSLKKLEKFSDL